MIFKPILPIFIIIPLGITLVVLSFLHKKPLAAKSFIRAGIAILLSVILARPMLTGIETDVTNSSLDVIFVVDATLSMAAEDYNGKTPRLDAVKEDLKNIIGTLKNAHYSLITFANFPRVVTPLSSDTMTLLREINSLRPQNSYYARGTNMNDVKESMSEILESARALQKDAEETGGDSRQTVLFFLGDGEFTREGEKLEDFSKLRPFIDTGYILGYGTTEGGYMKGDKDDYYIDSAGYVLDNSTYPNVRGVSKIDEKNLAKLASDLGVEYLHADSHGKVTTAANTIQTLARETSNLSTSASDIYFVFMPPLIILLAIEFINDKRSIV